MILFSAAAYVSLGLKSAAWRLQVGGSHLRSKFERLPKVFFVANISRNMADREKFFTCIIIETGKSLLCSKMNQIGRVVPQIWPKTWSN